MSIGPINPPMTDGQAWDKWRAMIDHPGYSEGSTMRCPWCWLLKKEPK